MKEKRGGEGPLMGEGLVASSYDCGGDAGSSGLGCFPVLVFFLPFFLAMILCLRSCSIDSEVVVITIECIYESTDIHLALSIYCIFLS